MSTKITYIISLPSFRKFMIKKELQKGKKYNKKKVKKSFIHKKKPDKLEFSQGFVVML